MNTKTKQLCLSALMLAMVFVVTRFIQIPIPLGYFNIGNSIILLFCLLIKCPYGIVAASLGSALADLTSYPIYTIPTLIIKALMPLLFYILYSKLKSSRGNKEAATYKGSHMIALIIATAVSTLIPLFGYSITGAFIAHSFYEGLAQFPGLALEYAANLIIIIALYKPICKLNKYI